MASVLRGDIRWAELDPTRGNEQQGTRPVLVISHDIFNERSGTVLAMAITSQPQRAGYPLTLPLGTVAGKEAWLKISQVRVLSTQRLGRKLGHATPEQLAQAIDGLHEIVGD
jgi:mRNA interferase MazF